MRGSKNQQNEFILTGESEMQLRAKEGKLLSFTLCTKPDYRVNWHHKVLCQVLNKFIRGEIRFLMVFMPPRHGKSELVSRRLPALLHGLHPNSEIMAASYNASFAGDMTTDVQKIMDTPEYLSLFPSSRIPEAGTRDPIAKRNQEEHHIIGQVKGKYRGQGVGGSFTGRGANWIIVDDPIKGHADANSPVFREKLWKWYTTDLRSRLQKGGSVLITLTRWHEDDLAGRLLALADQNPAADQWTVFNFPAIREDLRNPMDIRQVGDALWAEDFPLSALLAMKAANEQDFLALYQQRPSSPEGNLFKREWWKWYRERPSRFHEIIQSWDFAVKGEQNSDFTVGQVWGRIGADKYLLDQVRARTDFPGQCQLVRSLTAKWPQARRKLVEAKANGPAVVAMLKKQIGGLIEVEPMGDKVARANAVTADIQAGNVYLPEPETASWIGDYIEETASFPNCKHDDQVDATTQALNELCRRQTLSAPISGHGMVG